MRILVDRHKLLLTSANSQSTTFERTQQLWVQTQSKLERNWLGLIDTARVSVAVTSPMTR